MKMKMGKASEKIHSAACAMSRALIADKAVWAAYSAQAPEAAIDILTTHYRALLAQAKAELSELPAEGPTAKAYLGQYHPDFAPDGGMYESAMHACVAEYAYAIADGGRWELGESPSERYAREMEHPTLGDLAIAPSAEELARHEVRLRFSKLLVEIEG